MIPLGLTRSERNKLYDVLRDSHSIAVSIEILDLEHRRISDISHLLLDGQVDVDMHAEITRSASVQLLDVGRTLSFDSDSPADAAIYMDRMLRIEYHVRVPGVSDGWVEIPVFTGPITGLSRDDAVINVECQGKEALAMGAAWKPMVLKKGMKKVDAIQLLMERRAGETKFKFPNYRAKLGKDVSIGRQSVPWQVAKRLARSMDKQLFYDGRGHLRLRNLPKNAVWQFEHGDDGTVITEPEVSYSVDEFSNLVWVKGGTPKGSKRSLSFWFGAPQASSLSPERLGRNGVPNYMLEVVEDSDITNRKEAWRLAKTILDDRLLQTVDVAFDALPIPFLEPGDKCRVSTGEYATVFRMKQMSLPLGPGDAMSVGYTRKLHAGRRRTPKKKSNRKIRSGSFAYGPKPKKK